MEKYGVKYSEDEIEKTADDTKGKAKCPKCRSILAQNSPPYCQNCGTEPFEERAAIRDDRHGGDE